MSVYNSRKLAASLGKKDKNSNKKKRPWWKRGLRILGRTLFVLFIVFVWLVLFIRSEWGQDIIVGKLTSYISDKTETKVEINRLFITFSGDIELEGLYLEDKKGDTLIYSKNLQVGIPLWSIIRGNPISIDGLEWTGLRANITRKDTLEGFNFQFLIDAFASDSASDEVEKPKSDPPKISIGSIDLSDFKVNFDDAVAGMNANLDLGKLHFEGDNFDLKKRKFQVAELALENTKANYVQSKVSPPSDTTKSTLPYLSLNDLKIKNVIVHYKSIPEDIDADLNLAELQLQVPKADLAKKDIQVGEFILNNSNIQVKLNTKNKPIEKKPAPPKNSLPFIWPDWNVRVETIALQNNHIHYQLGKKSKNIKDFNPDYIVLNDFNFKATDIALSKKESAKIHLENISFHESSGLSLEQLAFYARLDPKAFTLNELVVRTGNSSINADIKAQFASLQKFIDKPDEALLALNLKKFIVDMNDAFGFEPELRKNEYLQKLAKHKFSGEIKADGKLSEVDLSKFLVNWGENTSIKTNGELKNLLDFDNFIADIDNFTFNSTRSDLINFVSETDLGIKIPKTVLAQTQLKGSLDDFKAKVQLTIPEGKVNIDGQFQQQEDIVFAANVNVINLELGKILNNPNIGQVAFKMIASGNGNTINDLDAKLASNFSKLEFNGYDFSALQLDGALNAGNGAVTIKYNDNNLDLLVDSKIELDSISPKIAIDFRLEGADLYALGLTEKEIKAKLMMNANFEGNTDQFDFKMLVSEGVAVYDESNYHLGTVSLTASASADSTSMDITSNFLNGRLRANAGIDSTVTAIQHHFEGYFSDSIEHTHSFENPVKLQLNMKLSESKLVTDFLVPDIKTMDTLEFNVDFDQADDKLVAYFDLPYMDYADKTIDSLQMRFNSTEADGKFILGFSKLNAQPLLMNRTYFDGDLKHGFLNLNFHAFNGQVETYAVSTQISGNKEDLKIHFLPEKLIFNSQDWSIPPNNEINIRNKEIVAESFVLSHEGETITIANDLLATKQNNIGIGFTDFKLANFLSLFNKEDLLASGDLQGNIVVIDPLENFGLKADFGIENLTALEAPLGKLTLKANSESGEKYTIDLGVNGDDVDIALKGDYSAVNTNSGLDFKLDLNKIEMKTIATISGESLNEASGYISGKLAIKGDVSSPKYDGYLQFNGAEVNVTQLNSKFRLNNDKIKIDNTAITLNKFTVQDQENNKFILDGSILTESFTDPAFDLSVEAKNFHAVNSKKEDNEFYYGTVNFDMDGTIKGKLSFPIVDMNIDINKSTDFTYVLSDSQAKIEKRDGVVEFVNKENPDNILTRKSDSKDATIFDGIELHAKLNIDKGATFNVIIDPQTGDNLNISGVGALDFNIAKNGRTTLTGRYEINDGHYSLSVYNLVKRKFDFEPGSSITWRGDPMDADLNVTAKYTVEASASSLMASQTAGASEEVNNRYRQKLPFYVFLNVNGELNQPELDFRLDMPEDSRGAIDGTVYGRIRQVNSNEDELNKQVFSLLVLNKFYPNSGSDGSDGGAASIARKNINDALSDQLNAFSGKLTGNTGIELDFGLNSYTDYQGESAQQRTDLNVSAQKKLLDERLIVQVGSNVNVEGGPSAGEENPLVGNASIQYLITEDGRWRIKGFRSSEYENVIDGQVFVNGLALIFQRQFNKFSELFVAPPKEEDSTEELQKEEEKENKEVDSETEKKVEN